jgi:hypothetical protein
MERLLCPIDATEQAKELKQQGRDFFSQHYSGHASGRLVDVLVVGYLDPRSQSATQIELTRNHLQRTGLSVQGDSRQAALNRLVELQPTPTRKPVRDTSGMHQNTESLSLQDLAKLLGNLKANSAEKSSAFRRLREILLQKVPSLKEKLNPKSGYVGYWAVSPDRAYVYLQPDLLVIDIRRPRSIEPQLKKAGIEILYRNNYQGRAGWTTGIRLRHNATTHQVQLITTEMIQALND